MAEVSSGKLKVINLFAGPGAGKSTVRAELFALMKKAGMNVEEVTEYAKDVTWEENQVLLSDQLFVLANQNRRLERLRGKVEWVVSDSPLLLGVHYSLPNYLPEHFEALAWEVWNTYENYNFFVNRGDSYSTVGRTQTLKEAIEIDIGIHSLLVDNEVPNFTVQRNTAATRIFSFLNFSEAN